MCESRPDPGQGPKQSMEDTAGLGPQAFQVPATPRWAWPSKGQPGRRWGAGAAHLVHTGLQQWVSDQFPVGLVVGEQLLQVGEETALLQVEAAVGCHGDAVVADFGLGPDWEGQKGRL